MALFKTIQSEQCCRQGLQVWYLLGLRKMELKDYLQGSLWSWEKTIILFSVDNILVPLMITGNKGWSVTQRKSLSYLKEVCSPPSSQNIYVSVHSQSVSSALTQSWYRQEAQDSLRQPLIPSSKSQLHTRLSCPSSHLRLAVNIQFGVFKRGL